MRVSVVNLGCKVNRVESDTIAKAYETRGAQLCSVPDADIVVVNTCTVTEEADKRPVKASGAFFVKIRLRKLWLPVAQLLLNPSFTVALIPASAWWIKLICSKRWVTARLLLRQILFVWEKNSLHVFH